MRFHLDEHVAYAIAAGLRRRGIDVTTASDAGLLETPDEQHLAFALQEGRSLSRKTAISCGSMHEAMLIQASCMRRKGVGPSAKSFVLLR